MYQFLSMDKNLYTNNGVATSVKETNLVGTERDLYNFKL
jgi:hypothetical protein